MTILKNEVKTISTIALNTMDLGKAVQNYVDNENEAIFYSKAFDFMDTSDSTIGNLRKNLENLSFKGNGDTFGYLAHFFGFDGWVNAGHYNKNNNKYQMVVFTYGDNIN